MKKIDKRRKITIIILGTVIYILLLAILFEKRGIIDVLSLKKELSNLKQEVEVLKEKKDRLEWEIKVLKENPRVVEEIARKELGFKYPEEIIIIIDESHLKFQK